MSIVGALQYLTITRRDLSYAVNQVSQFFLASTTDHFQAVKRILRYVKSTISYGLHFQHPKTSSLLGYSDADWARCVETQRPTYGHSIFLDGNLISWSAKKQPTVSRSNCEAEYRAIANTTAGIVWVINLLRDLHVVPTVVPTLLCDNKSALFLSQNPISKRAKHINIDYHFVRELVASGKLITRYILTHLQLADIFTKSLSRPSFELFRAKLRVGPPPLSLKGCYAFQTCPYTSVVQTTKATHTVTVKSNSLAHTKERVLSIISIHPSPAFCLTFRPPLVSSIDAKMNVEKLQKMAGAVRTGGKGSVRRKKKAVHKTTTTDDKRLQSTLKRIGVNAIPAIEEVNIFKDETVIQFLNPKVQASIAANTWVVSGSPQTKKLQDILPGILNQLGPDNLDNLRKLAEQFQKQAPGGGEGTAAATTQDDDDDDEVPELVAGETFEAAAEEGQKS
ncbi:unnamed protein product [Lactuca saligna]|uniref:Nascent polypeptide-associated complex subunit beta n=1 Tax=Lactuca saligna TaxID=75948 RepID=A0AA36E9Q0_LACSI|nr:unnamed protein product [Lactuca saligna]